MTTQPLQRASACPLCGSTRAFPYCQLPAGSYVRCTTCGLVATDPLLSPEQLQQRAEHWAREFHKSQLKVSQHFDRNFQQIVFKPHLSRLQRYRQNGRIIDVGCGTGGFVDAAQAAGWDSYGVDVSSSVEIAQQHGLKVSRTTLKDSPFEAQFFDAATLFDVIEHIPNPASLVGRLREVVRDGGCVYLQTPNLAGLNSRLLGPRWESLEPEDHACLYTPGSLAYLLEKNGFHVERVLTVDLNLVELRHAFQKTRGEAGRKERQQERRQLIGRVMRSRWLQLGRNAANVLLSLFKWGDKLVVEARKTA